MATAKKTKFRIESGEIIHQKCWQYIKELNGTDPEHLSLAALTDCRRDYTYLQMYDMWDSYARVFSALGITGKNHSRAGMTGTPSAETSFAFFGLNMTGASVSMLMLSDEKRFENLREVVRKEHITDLILTDHEADAHLIRQILKEKEGMGIHNLIMLHIPVGGDFAFAWEKLACRINYRRMREMPGAVFMGDLLEKYRDHEISYSENAVDDAAVIVHTSGTTEGVPKPVPFTDSAVNDAVKRNSVNDLAAAGDKRLRMLLCYDMYRGADFLGMIAPLACGGTAIAIPTVKPWLNLFAAAEQYRVTSIVYFAGLADFLDLYFVKPDLSSLRSVLLVGSYSSAETISRFKDFFRACGSEAVIHIGYGMTEAGCGITMTGEDTEGDSVGYLLPGMKAKLRNEEDKCFYEPDGREHTGVLYVSTPSLSSGCLDGEVLFELDEIDGEKYLNTNDLFTIRGDGEMCYIGRANRFFINEEGVKFDAGLIERALMSQKGINSCGFVAEYNKLTHDTEPALYVETSRGGSGGYRLVKDALEQVYIRDELIGKSALPVRCVLTDDIPRNASGKVDVHQITEGNVHGLSYKVEGVYENDELREIELTPGGAGETYMNYLGCDCAYQ